jgi:hypothetical protein
VTADSDVASGPVSLNVLARPAPRKAHVAERARDNEGGASILHVNGKLASKHNDKRPAKDESYSKQKGKSTGSKPGPTPAPSDHLDLHAIVPCEFAAYGCTYQVGGSYDCSCIERDGVRDCIMLLMFCPGPAV